MKKHIIAKLAILFLLILLNLNIVYALGVTPGKKIVEFEPRLRTENTITVVNSDYKEFRAAIIAKGELEPYIRLNANSLDFAANQGEQTFTYELLLPESLSEPGIHEGEIVIREIPQTQGSGEIEIGALVAVASKVHVRVPYPGKYAEVNLDILSDTKEVKFILRAINLGEEDIGKARATINIYDSNNELITIINSDEIDLKTKQRKELITKWNAEVALGNYRATVIFDYDGVVQTINKDFTLGDFFIIPLDLSVDKFKLGDVAKFNLLVENLADQGVPRFTAEMTLFNKEDIQVAAIQSVPDTVGPKERKEINLFWVTENIEVGTYHGKLKLKYADKELIREIKLSVEKDKITAEIVGVTGFAVAPTKEKPGQVSGANKLIVGLFALVIILLISVIVLIILFIRKK